MFNAIVNKTNENFTWFTPDHPCHEHRLQMLDFTLRILLFKNAKWLFEELDTARRKNKQKRKKMNLKPIFLSDSTHKKESNKQVHVLKKPRPIP